MEKDTRKDYQKPDVEIVIFSEGAVNCITTSVPISNDPWDGNIGDIG